MEGLSMQASVEIAQRVLAVLEREKFRDAVNALKIAMILLPLPPSSLSVPSETPQVPGESVLEVQ